MPIRIDNLFYVTPDVALLSNFYSSVLNVPARRAQVEAPGLMWAEVPVGGMELSFRKAEATTQIHPRDASEFLEARPGHGVTVSFEVKNTSDEIERLRRRGCRFRGEPLICTGGLEVISIFEDPSGRAVQLYEPRFGFVPIATRPRSTASTPMRENSGPRLLKAASEQQQESILTALGATTDETAHRWGYVTREEVLVGSNLRDGRNLAYSAAFYEQSLSVPKAFYRDALGLELAYESPDRLRFDVDGTILEFRRATDGDDYVRSGGLLSRGRGGIAMLEVRQIDDARERMRELQVRELKITKLEDDEAGKRAAYIDPDGNVFEFWQRLDNKPIVTAKFDSRDSATMETWDFHQLA